MVGRGSRKTEFVRSDLAFRQRQNLLRLKAAEPLPGLCSSINVWRDIYRGSARFLTPNHHGHHVLRTLRAHWVFGSLAPPTLGPAAISLQ
jgi:hypothetical protein